MNNVELERHVNNAILKLDEVQRAYEAKLAAIPTLVDAAVAERFAKADKVEFADGQGGTLTVLVLTRKPKT